MIAKLALRNLHRNHWRSFLTAGGIAVAVAMMIWTMSFIDGWMQEMVRGTTALQSLQVKVESQNYVDEPAIFHAFDFDNEFIQSVENHPGVAATTARVNLFGLIGNEERSQVARLIGVDPAREREATPVNNAVIQGSWLTDSPPEDDFSTSEVVIGEILARQLQVSVGDELVAFLEAADGSLGNELFVVTGIVRTGNSAIDRQGAYIHLETAQFLGALESKGHAVAVRIFDPAQAEFIARQIEPIVARASFDQALSVRSWQQVMPAIAQMVDVSGVSNWIMYFIIYLVASLGIMNTQRMSALERRREFAVLMAIGVTPAKLFRIVVAETTVLGILGASIGALLGIGLSYYHSRSGIDLSAFTEETTFTYMGVSFSERIYTSFSATAALEPVLIMLLVAMFCGLWPAAQSARINITQALSGRN